MQSIDSKIQSRTYGSGKGCVVTPGDFVDHGRAVRGPGAASADEGRDVAAPGPPFDF